MGIRRPYPFLQRYPRCRHLLIALGSIAWNYAPPALSSDDPYLDAINATAEEVSVDQHGVINAKQPPKPVAPVPAPVEPAANPAGEAVADTLEGFEKRLHNESRSLARFYSKLTDAQKAEVFNEYVQGHDIESLRRTIVRLYTSR